MTNELYYKYQNVFKYVDTIIYGYLEGAKNLNRFRQISMDYDDVKQEIYLEVIKAVEEYDKKYVNSDKVHILPHVKQLVFYLLNNILRNNKNKVFISIDNDLQEDMLKVNEQLKKESSFLEFKCPDCSGLGYIDVENQSCFRCKGFGKLLKNELPLHPDTIPETRHRDKINDEEVKRIIRSVHLKEIDYEILELKIIFNYTFEEIQKTLNIPSRHSVFLRYQKGIKKLKSKYKTLDNLLEQI